MATIVYDDYLTAASKYLDPQKQQALKDLNALYQNQANTVTSQYDTEIGKANTAYEDQYRENAVQKLINERQVAENMANLGLTDSGLNRTQQTAVQLSYANQKGAIDRAKQAQIDALTQQKAQNLAAIEQNRLSGQNEINQYYADLAAENATSAYNTALEQDRQYREAQLQAQLELQKKALEYQAEQAQTNNYIIQTSGGLLRRDYEGSLKDNNVDVIYNTDGTTTYIDNNSGKKTTLSSNINPYTGTINKDTANGVFSNGYQPNNVNGVKLVSSGAKANINGNEQTVWKANGKYYLWSGKDNKYIQLNNAELKEIGAIKR